MTKNRKERDIIEIINTILFLALVVLMGFAVQQKFFEEQKCDMYCKENLRKINIHNEDQILECGINWDALLTLNKSTQSASQFPTINLEDDE